MLLHSTVPHSSLQDPSRNESNHREPIKKCCPVPFCEGPFGGCKPCNCPKRDARCVQRAPWLDGTNRRYPRPRLGSAATAAEPNHRPALRPAKPPPGGSAGQTAGQSPPPPLFNIPRLGTLHPHPLQIFVTSSEPPSCNATQQLLVSGECFCSLHFPAFFFTAFPCNFSIPNSPHFFPVRVCGREDVIQQGLRLDGWNCRMFPEIWRKCPPSAFLGVWIGRLGRLVKLVGE